MTKTLAYCTPEVKRTVIKCMVSVSMAEGVSFKVATVAELVEQSNSYQNIKEKHLKYGEK
jgi:hypothetical protein